MEDPEIAATSVVVSIDGNIIVVEIPGSDFVPSLISEAVDFI